MNNPSSTGLGIGALIGGGVATAGLLILAFIAAIVLTVVAYKRFVSNGATKVFAPNDPEAMSSFLRFDTLLIDKILKALYLFSAIFAALFYAALVLGSFITALGSFGSNVAGAAWGAFFSALIGGIIVLAIAEILIRLAFEFNIMFVVIAQNTTTIRKSLTGDQPEEPAPAASKQRKSRFAYAHQAAPQAAPVAAAPMTAQHYAEPQRAPEPQPAATSDFAAQPAAEENRFCMQCGEPLSNEDKFCKKCGTPAR